MEIHKKLAVAVGMKKDSVYLSKNGESYLYDPKRDSFHLSDPVPGEDFMIDGSGVGDVGNIVLRDREILSDDGIFIAVVTIDRKKKKIIAQPQVTSRGFVYIKANHKLMHDSIEVIRTAINNNFEHKKFDWTELKQDIRGDLEKFLYKQTNRRPVVLPVVMEVNQNRHRAMQKKNAQNSEKKTNTKNTSKNSRTKEHKTVEKDK